MAGLLTEFRKKAKVRTRLQSIHDDVRERLRALRDKPALEQSHRRLEQEWIDPRIAYPSYKSFDDLIDLDRLKRLDGYLRERLERRTADGRFWTGPYTLKVLGDRLPGSKMIELTRNTKGASPDYFDLDQEGLWEPSEHAEEFSEILAFARSLPFKSTGRILVMYDFVGSPVTPHRDHDKIEISHEFIWFRTNLVKPFYMMDKATGRKAYVDGYSAWFDTVNQFHGADAAPGLSLSLRVDGRFTDDLRARMPVPDRNVASTASLWAAIGDRTASDAIH
jgi:hypothetical protein